MAVVLIFCIKRRKYLERIGQYWCRKREQYKNQSDKAPETDSGGPEDHGVRNINIKVGVLYQLYP